MRRGPLWYLHAVVCTREFSETSPKAGNVNEIRETHVTFGVEQIICQFPCTLQSYVLTR